MAAGRNDTLLTADRCPINIFHKGGILLCLIFFYRFHDLVDRHRPDDHIDLRDLLPDLFPVALCQTSCCDQHFDIGSFFQLSDLDQRIDTFFLGISDEAAGIHHYNFSLLLIIRKLIALFRQHSKHHFGVYQIFITAK